MLQCINTCHCFDNKCWSHIAEKLNTGTSFKKQEDQHRISDSSLMLTLCNLANNVLLSVLLLGLNSRGPQLCSDHKPSLQEEDRETEHSVHELEAGMEKLDRQTDRQTDCNNNVAFYRMAIKHVYQCMHYHNSLTKYIWSTTVVDSLHSLEYN